MIHPWLEFYLLPTNVSECLFIVCVSCFWDKVASRMEYGPRGPHLDRQLNQLWLIEKGFWIFVDPTQLGIQHSPSCKAKLVSRKGRWGAIKVDRRGKLSGN